MKDGDEDFLTWFPILFRVTKLNYGILEMVKMFLAIMQLIGFSQPLIIEGGSI